MWTNEFDERDKCLIYFCNCFQLFLLNKFVDSKEDSERSSLFFLITDHFEEIERVDAIPVVTQFRRMFSD